MPKYKYKCDDCEKVMELYHFLNEKMFCIYCDSENMTKIPMMFSKKNLTAKKVGEITEEFIDEQKKETKEYKENYKRPELKK